MACQGTEDLVSCERAGVAHGSYMAGFFVQSSNDLKGAAVIVAFQGHPEEAHLWQGALPVAAAPLLWCREKVQGCSRIRTARYK